MEQALNSLANLGRIFLDAIGRLGRAALFLFEVVRAARVLVRRHFLVIQ